ncbi:MAG: hypothetical protein ABIN74_11830 [Ferruginibacter sp.]
MFTFFPRIYFLSFEKNYGLRKAKAILFMYRKDKRWLLTHRINEATRLNIFQLKWYYFLFRLYRKRNKKFFGYSSPHGIVKRNKIQ